MPHVGWSCHQACTMRGWQWSSLRIDMMRGHQGYRQCTCVADRIVCNYFQMVRCVPNSKSRLCCVLCICYPANTSADQSLHIRNIDRGHFRSRNRLCTCAADLCLHSSHCLILNEPRRNCISHHARSSHYRVCMSSQE